MTMKPLQVMVLLRRGICFAYLFVFCTSPLWHPVLQPPFQQHFKLIFKQLLGTFFIEIKKKQNTTNKNKKPQNKIKQKNQKQTKRTVTAGCTWELPNGRAEPTSLSLGLDLWEGGGWCWWAVLWSEMWCSRRAPTCGAFTNLQGRSLW